MCRERRRTRDRLLEYDIPLNPHAAGLSMVYPWENLSLSVLSEQILSIAKKYNFKGTNKDFWERFSGGTIITGTLDSFPIEGNEANLYLDTETNILYYFKITTYNVSDEIVAKIGAAIVQRSIVAGSEETFETRLYIPVRALPLENLIYDCGDAAEYID